MSFAKCMIKLSKSYLKLCLADGQKSMNKKNKSTTLDQNLPVINVDTDNQMVKPEENLTVKSYYLKAPKKLGGIYFYSSMVSGKKNVFVTPEYLDLMVNAFRVIELRYDIKNLAYVVMPNHFYWIFKLSDKKDNPLEVYSAFKKEVTLAIIKNLLSEAKEGAPQFSMHEIFRGNNRVVRSTPRKILWAFKEAAKSLDNSTRYKVWEPKSRCFLIENEDKLKLNLKLIKDAPLRDRWQLVSDFKDYPYLYIAEEYLDKLN